MIRQRYALAWFPLPLLLWLRAPIFALDDGRDAGATTSGATPSATSVPTWPSPAPPPRGPRHGGRRRLFAGVAAAVSVVLVVLVVAGFTVALNLRGATPPSSATTHALLATATAGAHATESAAATSTAASTSSSVPTPTTATSGTPNPATFVCANPAGSSLVYAYQNQSGAIFTVTGCSAPKVVYAAGLASPLAWSPSNRYLAVDAQPTVGTAFTLDTVMLVDTQAGTVSRTRFSLNYGLDPSVGQTYRIFIGWLDDATFLGAVVPVASGHSDLVTGPASIVRVNAATQQETKVATVPWFADMKVRDSGKYLFYGGYQSGSTGQGALHRLDLTTGQDTQLVPLGFAGQAGCQGTPLCNWTAPWDVRADGTGVVFHNPGPTKPWTDTYQPPDSPLYLDNVGASSQSSPIVTKLATSLTIPVISPDGAYVATTGASYDPANPFSHPQTGLTQFGGTTTTLVDGSLIAWRGDSRAIVLMYTNGPLLYNLSSGTTTLLQAGTSSYIWGN